MAPAKITAINRITTMKKILLHHNLTAYLPLQDVFNLGITCKSLFANMIERIDEAAEGNYRITKIGSIDIPENVFPHVIFLFTILT